MHLTFRHETRTRDRIILLQNGIYPAEAHLMTFYPIYQAQTPEVQPLLCFRPILLKACMHTITHPGT